MSEQRKELGALWRRKGQKTNYLSGTININGTTMNVVVFENSFKGDNERAPDFRIYESQPQGGDSKPAPAQTAQPQRGGYNNQRGNYKPQTRQASQPVAQEQGPL
jgi:hypothetical protein